MKLATSLAIGSFTALAVCLGGCRDGSPTAAANTTSAETPMTAPSPSTVTVPDPHAASPTAGMVPDKPAQAAPAVALSDSQILQITHTANVGEIAQAKLALDRTKDPRVKKLAQMMLTDHTDADKKGGDLAKSEKLALADSPTSTSVKSDGDSTLDDLKAKTGKDFDSAYVDAQVAEHQAVLDTIDGKLLPNAQDADVKSFVTTIRPKIADHLKHAQMLQADLKK